MIGCIMVENAVVRVGDGRGFVVIIRNRPLILTAAHCCPVMPVAHAAGYASERTWELVAPLARPTRHKRERRRQRGAAPVVHVECLFIDPIADVAVLGPPDDQQFGDEAVAYDALVDSVEPLEIAPPPPMRRKRTKGYMTTMHVTDDEGVMRETPIQVGPVEHDVPTRIAVQVLALDGRWIDIVLDRNGPWLWHAGADIASGMSGSPILLDGRAIGLISTGGMDPVLTEALPGRFLPL